MPRNIDSESYKLVLLGAGGVGKSAIFVRFTQSFFAFGYDPTTLENRPIRVVVDSAAATIADIGELNSGWVLDVPGTRVECMLKAKFSMKKCEGVLLVFSITDRSSFDEILKVHKEILNAKDCDEFPVVLVGNKADMDRQRKVSNEEAKALASELKIPYVECSAKIGTNVDLAFEGLVRIVRSFQPPPEKKCNIL